MCSAHLVIESNSARSEFCTLDQGNLFRSLDIRYQHQILVCPHKCPDWLRILLLIEKDSHAFRLTLCDDRLKVKLVVSYR